MVTAGSRSANLVSALQRDRQTADLKKLRVAIVHDWLVGGGAELVVEQLHKLFPDAPIYTSYCTAEWRERLEGKVVTGWLQWLGPLRKFIPPLRILWFTSLRLKGYDLVISSSGAEAKGIKVPESTVHINYCHAPTHYYWSRYESYLKQPGFGAFNPLARLGLRLLVGPLRRWDKKAAARPDYIIANSTHIQQEIKKYYGRKSVVIHPPVYFERFAHTGQGPRGQHGFVISGRQTPYKRFDLAVLACNRLQLPLTVIGDGPDHKRLRALAGPTVTFLGKVSDAVVEEEFRNAGALIFPGLDDFGITPVEAMAAGTPVIAYKAGGALDYVKPGVTGEFFARQTPESLAQMLQKFDPGAYNKAILQGQARQFSSQVFQTKFSQLILKLMR
jgi:glycosyltransferase involved in cell wall biosynthesis